MRTAIAIPMCLFAGLLMAATDAADEWKTTDPPGIDFKNASPKTRQQTIDLLRTRSCSCGCKMKLAQCLSSGMKCEAAPAYAKIILDGYIVGRSTDEIATLVPANDASNARWSDRAIKIDISPVDHPSKGPENAKITILEFADYQCPYCKQAEVTLKAIEQAYPGQVRLIFANLPLGMHPFANGAAKAALAAGEQGKFWEMHDLLLANQSLTSDSLSKYAAQLGLDVDRFKSDSNSTEIEKVVVADVKEANRLLVPGTPSFFVNGRQLLKGELTPQAVEELINQKGNK